MKVRVLPKKELYLNNRWYCAGDVLEVTEITEDIKNKVMPIKLKKKESKG